MADEQVTVSGINWKETFPFTLIFRTFRIAIHPSKLILALLALLSIYIGGRFLDALWPTRFSAVHEELVLYETAWLSRHLPNPQDFDEMRQDRVERYRQEIDAERQRIGKSDADLGDIKWAIVQDRNRDAQTARDAYDRADKSTDEKARAAERARDERIRAVYDRAYGRWNLFEQYYSVGLFESFYEYELSQINLIIRGARTGVWMGREGVFVALRNFFLVGPAWAISEHPFYFLLYGIFFLTVWAIFGGAISRIAAVHVARDEKISIRQALAFSTSKFLSFVSAPIIPLVIVIVVGLIIAVGGFLGNIPFFGPILVGGLFFLALAAGFVMTLVLLGLAGGFNLMYPTIAVEGSDSFDAISRSFSYLYARPWRLAFYTFVAIIYGALTYTFVRLFIFLMLYLAHTFTGLFFFREADSTWPLWPTMWPNPMATGRITYDVDFLTLAKGQDVGAGLLAFWVYLTVGMLGAFAISFYFSANTIIYFLMRREVDATELDDVYLEQSEEEFADSAAPVAAAPVTGADVASGPAPEPAAPLTPAPPVNTDDDADRAPPV